MGTKKIQNSLNAGELSPKLDARTDLTKYHTGTTKMSNALAKVQGGAIKRPGGKWIAKGKGASNLLPFSFSADDSIVLEAGDGYMRFFKNSDRVMADPVTITDMNPAPSTQIRYNFVTAGADINKEFNLNWYDSDTGEFTTSKSIPSLDDDYGRQVLVDDSGNIFARTVHNVYAYDGDMVLRTDWGTNGVYEGYLTAGMGINPVDGTLVVLAWYGSAILNTDGSLKATLAIHVDYQIAIRQQNPCFTPNGTNIIINVQYISYTRSHRVDIMDASNGAFVSSLIPRRLDYDAWFSYNGIVINDAGNKIWISVQKWNGVIFLGSYSYPDGVFDSVYYAGANDEDDWTSPLGGEPIHQILNSDESKVYNYGGYNNPHDAIVLLNSSSGIWERQFWNNQMELLDLPSDAAYPSDSIFMVSGAARIANEPGETEAENCRIFTNGLTKIVGGSIPSAPISVGWLGDSGWKDV